MQVDQRLAGIGKAVDLDQIMQHGYQLPRAVDLGLATQSEASDPDGFTSMPKSTLPRHWERCSRC